MTYTSVNYSYTGTMNKCVIIVGEPAVVFGGNLDAYQNATFVHPYYLITTLQICRIDSRAYRLQATFRVFLFISMEKEIFNVILRKKN